MTLRQQFDDDNLARAEDILLGHDIAKAYFKGELYTPDNRRLRGMLIERHAGDMLTLDERMVGRLFMIPDGSVVRALKVRENENAPAGLNVQSRNPFLAEDEQGSVIVFRDETAPAMWIDALHIQRCVLADSTPARLATIAFGLQAISAFRFGFSYVQLFAAGRGPLKRGDSDVYAGYDVWPTFGFDAPIQPVDLNRAPLDVLVTASTVQDVVATAPQWWSAHGTGRIMRFDLAPGSRSWSVLLNYLYQSLVENQQ